MGGVRRCRKDALAAAARLLDRERKFGRV
ncbi:uncharacterized protein G2W53_013273 [Senna tora]|uniref:Uncharacterized protein n=1 Tax=Senna tora TaxID=362788 RepID=A0A834TYL1_9FABA|nr:uncharacterized protein G2W53_013273 [Senna tora]